jgi:hypothetical protein
MRKCVPQGVASPLDRHSQAARTCRRAGTCPGAVATVSATWRITMSLAACGRGGTVYENPVESSQAAPTSSS